MISSPAPAGTRPDPAMVGLLRRLPGGAVDLDDVVAGIEALGISDRTAQRDYGAPSVFVLAERVLAGLRQDPTARPTAADQPEPGRPSHVGTAVARCGLYLTVVLAAVAGNRTLAQVGWVVPAAAAVLACGGAQALGHAGRRVAEHRGPGRATRLLAAGFLTLAAIWCAVVAVGPTRLVGTDRPAAYAVGCTGLALAAVLAAALATGTAGPALGYGLPIWALAGAVLSGAWDRLAPDISPASVLPVLVALAAARVYHPALRRRTGWATGLDGRDLRAGGARFALGAAQAAAVILVWQAGPAGTPAPGVVPVLAAAPLVEIFVAWHIWQGVAGLDRYDTMADYTRHVRGVATVTVAALVPPLAVGMALVAAARQLPYGLADHQQARALVLALAAGTLLTGVLAATRLLAAHHRPARAALVAALPAAVAVALGTAWGEAVPGRVLESLTGSTGALPSIVACLAVAQLAGLVAVALTVFDHRSRR